MLTFFLHNKIRGPGHPVSVLVTCKKAIAYMTKVRHLIISGPEPSESA
jgi:hypothetical protein